MRKATWISSSNVQENAKDKIYTTIDSLKLDEEVEEKVSIATRDPYFDDEELDEEDQVFTGVLTSEDDDLNNEDSIVDINTNTVDDPSLYGQREDEVKNIWRGNFPAPSYKITLFRLPHEASTMLLST